MDVFYVRFGREYHGNHHVCITTETYRIADGRGNTMEAPIGTIYIEDIETAYKYGLDDVYLYTLVSKTDPTTIVGRTYVNLIATRKNLHHRNIKTYTVHFRDSDSKDYIFATDDEVARFILINCYDTDMVDFLDREQTSREIVWKSAVQA
jgi:hypothetical protein